MPAPHTSPFVPIGPQQNGPPAGPPPITQPVEAPPVPSAAPPDPTAALTDQWLQGPDGKPVKVGISSVPNLVKNFGFTPLDPAQAAKLDSAEQHRGLLSTLGAVGQGGLETLAPIVGPIVEDALGYSFSKQRELAEAHPIAHGAGQVLGAVAPAIATLGGSAPASAAGVTAGAGLKAAAKASAPEVLATLGAKVGAGVETAVGSNALGRIVSSAANQATQAAGYAGADWANRAIQGDPKATAEQLFHQGAGAVILGGGLGTFGGLMNKVADAHVGDFVGSLRALEARGGVKATGMTQGLLRKWEKQVGPERLEEIGRFLGKEGGIAPGMSFKEMLDVAETRFKGPAVKEMDTILQAAYTGKPGSVAFMDEIFDKIYADPLIQRWRQNPLDKEAFAKFKGVLGDLLDANVVRNSDGTIRHYLQITPESLHNLSMAFGEKARGYAGFTDPSSSAFNQAYDAARVAVNKRLDQLLETVGKQKGGLSGEAMKAWKDAKFRYQAGLFLEDGANLGLMRTIGNNQVSLTEGLGAGVGALTGHAVGATLLGAGVAVARREGSAVENLAARRTADFLERLQTQSGQKIGESINRIFQGAAGAASAAVSRAHDEHSVSHKNFDVTAARILRSANDPEFVAQHVTQNFGPLVGSDPKVMMALQQTASQAAQHLASQLPQYQRGGPFDQKYTPSVTEVAKLSRHLTTVQAPETVLDRIAAGTYTAEDGLALAAAYPSLHPQIRTQVAEALAEALAKGEAVPQKSHLGLTQFLGVTLSSRYSGPTIAAVQAAYAAQQQQPQAKPNPNVDFKSSAQVASETQAREMRGLGKA